MKKNYPYFITAKFENVITNSRSKKPLIKFMWAYIVLVLIMFSTTYSLNAQFSKLYDFKAGRDSILNGATFSKLITDGSSLFGMTAGGGFYNSGTIFKINPDGSGFQRLLEFDGKTQGGNPNGYLTIVGDSLYGITQNGGFYNVGVIFKISKDGSGYQKLYDFDGTFSGGAPNGSLTLVNDTLYGMTTDYGSSNSGTIFKINRSGQGFQKREDRKAAGQISPGAGGHPDGTPCPDDEAHRVPDGAEFGDPHRVDPWRRLPAGPANGRSAVPDGRAGAVQEGCPRHGGDRGVTGAFVEARSCR